MALFSRQSEKLKPRAETSPKLAPVSLQPSKRTWATLLRCQFVLFRSQRSKPASVSTAARKIAPPTRQLSHRVLIRLAAVKSAPDKIHRSKWAPARLIRDRSWPLKSIPTQRKGKD